MRAVRAVVLAIALVSTACGNDTDDPETSRPRSSAEQPTSQTESAERSETIPAPGAEAQEPNAPGDPREGAPDTVPQPHEVAEAADDATSDRSADASVYVPPAGRYEYDATGYVETTGLTDGRESVSPRSSDEVTIDERVEATRLTVVTREDGRDSSQEVVVDVTDREARLVRLTHRPESGGLAYSVNPDRPALLARLPYRSGDTWEITWNDPAIGIAGVGTGTVAGPETVATPAGSFEVFVITVEQRLRGTVEGTLTVTSWIDPVTGIQVKQHRISEFRDATGASRSDTTRVLRQHPS